MSREVQVRFYESGGVRSPSATRRNIYVKSLTAGERVMKTVTNFIEQKLKLKVNREKSAVDHVWNRKFLGHRFLPQGKLAIAPKSLKAVKDKIRSLTKRSLGRSIEKVVDRLNSYLTGWVTYYRHAQVGTHLKALDSWIASRLRCYRLKQCKNPETVTEYLIARGIPREIAWGLTMGIHGWWELATANTVTRAMGKGWLEELEVENLYNRYQALKHQ